MPVLKTTSAATSTSAPKDSPMKMLPSSSAIAAGLAIGEPKLYWLETIAIGHAARGDGQQDRPAQGLAGQRRVLAARHEAFRVDDPGMVRIEHTHVRGSAWCERTVSLTKGLGS